MHSRIIQLETNPSNIDFSSPLSEEDINWLISVVADYVVADPNHEETLRSFLRQLGIDRNGDEYFTDDIGTGIVIGEATTAYMRKEYERFAQALSDLANEGFEGFLNGCNSVDNDFAYLRLKSAYSDEYDVWIANSNLGVCTLQEFLRIAKPGERYYFGGTLDYHW